MICENCKTLLPDGAVACWKCGTPTLKVSRVLEVKAPRDILHILSAFFVALVLFACVGWPLPFVIWGGISQAANSSPLWADVGGVASGFIMIGTAVAFIALTWWASYWVIARLFAKPSAQ